MFRNNKFPDPTSKSIKNDKFFFHLKIIFCQKHK